MPPAKKCPSCPFLFKPKKWPWHIQTDFLHLMAKCLLLLVMSLYVSITSSITSSSSLPAFLTRFISISMPRIAHHLSFPCHHARRTLHNGVHTVYYKINPFPAYTYLGCSKNCYIVHHFFSDTILNTYLYSVYGTFFHALESTREY